MTYNVILNGVKNPLLLSTNEDNVLEILRCTQNDNAVEILRCTQNDKVECKNKAE